MKELFADIDAGMIGLIFFFLVFCGIAVSVMLPSAKARLEGYRFIPFAGDDE